MPLVPPRGLYGNIATTFRPAIDVFGVLDGQNTYTRAKYVWVWCGPNDTGAWQVVWGADISPPVAPAAAYEEAGTQVRVTWTLPTPNISNGWRIYRPDGSLAGTATAVATEFVDGSPLPGSGTYSVAGTDATGNESAKVPTNSLTISLQPATATATLSGTTATVAWTTGPDGQPDSWSVWNKTDGTWASTPLAATARSHAVTGLVPGKQYVFSVYPYLSGSAVANQGTPRDTATLSVPAAVPTSVVLAAINPPTAGNASADQIQLSWAAPASGSASGYEVESSTNGTTWTASTDDITPVVFVSAVALYARVRATSPGGVSPWVQVGPVSPHPDEPANVPASVALAATNPPLSNLRLTWAAPAGSVTGYEVQTSPNNSTWSASSDDTTPSDWATTAAGYMRVRSLSAGGASGWVTKGPVTPVNDVTDPPAATITSWKPESSYGRMVVRGNWANNADVAFGEMWWKVGSGAYTKVWGKSAVTPGAAFGVALTTQQAGETITALVRTYDDWGNYSDKTASYTLTATPKVFMATDSATWRVDEWRTDGVAGSTGVMYGWTSSGHNQGCWFYGEAVQDFFSTHEVTTAYVEYVRDGSSQGMSAASPVMVQVHTHATQPAGAPSYASSGESTGTAVARVTSPPGDGGYCYLSATQIDLLAGSYKGIHVYDGVANGNTYMRLYPAGHVGDSRTSGRLVANHLG